MPVRQDHSGCRNVQRKPKKRNDQNKRWKG